MSSCINPGSQLFVNALVLLACVMGGLACASGAVPFEYRFSRARYIEDQVNVAGHPHALLPVMVFGQWHILLGGRTPEATAILAALPGGPHICRRLCSALTAPVGGRRNGAAR